MERLDVCKVLLALEKMKTGFKKDCLVWLVSMTDDLEKAIVEAYGISLDKDKTTPKLLYNKPYKDLNKEQHREYTQIKRTIMEALLWQEGRT